MYLFPMENSKVTEELRNIVESGVNVWDFEYPSYYKGDEKAAFEQKVLDHFWTRQIGQETVGRFLLYFRRTVREIMPYYIQRYESEAVMKALDDPFGNVDIEETHTQTIKGSNSSSGTATTNDKATINNHHSGVTAESDTPQGSILFDADLASTDVNLKYASRIAQNQDMAQDETVNTGTATSQESGSNEQTTTYTTRRKGNQGVNTYAHDMNELRQSFLNIDMEVINELEICFLGVY